MVEGFRKKTFNEAEEIPSLDMGARNQYSSITFLGEFIESISQVFVANVRDFYTVVFGCGKGSRIPKVTYHFSSIVE